MSARDVRVGFCAPEDQPAIVTLARESKQTKDFPYHWERWGNWVSQPPIVVKYRGGLVGFHAATFSPRTLYVNSYYQGVSLPYQGRGFGGVMVEFLLNQSALKGMKRLKMKTPQGSLGYDFWTGFGLRPFAYHEHVSGELEYLFDVSLEGVTNTLELIKKFQGKEAAHPIFVPPQELLGRYLAREGVRRIV